MKTPIGPCISLAEAARLLKMQYPEVRHLARTHRLTAIRTPQGWMVSLTEVQKLVEQKSA